MLETFIKARFLEKLRSGPAGPYVDGFANYLSKASYNHWFWSKLSLRRRALRRLDTA